MSRVADYSGAPPGGAALAAAGFIGVMRYLSPQPNPKNLTPTETADLWAHNLMVGVVWEGPANPLSTNPTVCGTDAARQAANIGFPLSAPILVAADYDAAPGDWPPLAGWGDTFSRASGHPWRIYGKGQLGDQLARDHHFGSFWQTTAWSDGFVSAYASLYQQTAQVTINGTVCDVNAVLQPDWGGWHPVLPPAPLPPVQTYPEDQPVTRHPLTIGTDPNGNGYNDLAVPFNSVLALFANGADPQTNQHYTPIPRLSASAEGGATRVELEGGPPGGQVLVFVVTDP